MTGISTGAALLISAGVAAATTASTIGYEVSNQPSSPKATTGNSDAAAAAQTQAAALKARRGMAATTLSNPVTGNAQVQKSTLG